MSAIFPRWKNESREAGQLPINIYHLVPSSE